MVLEESEKRVAMSQRVYYQSHGRDRALAPWSKDQNTALDQWSYAPAPRVDSEDDVDDAWYDDDRTSYRDCIDDWDMHYYCSD
jgi:exonuclease 3'-5' domain-containing protein 1